MAPEVLPQIDKDKQCGPRHCCTQPRPSRPLPYPSKHLQYLCSPYTYEEGFDTLRKSCTPDTLTLLNRLLADGFLQPGHKPANCNMFVLPKTTEKCSLIADLRFLNKFSPDPLPHFVLPRLTDIVDVISHFPPRKLWATTLDLTNFYWSLVLPPDFWDVFMTPIGSYSTLSPAVLRHRRRPAPLVWVLGQRSKPNLGDPKNSVSPLCRIEL